MTGNIAGSPEYENHQKQFDYVFQKTHLTHTSSYELSKKYRLDIHHYHHSYLTSEKSGYSISCQELILRNQVGEAIHYKNCFGRAFHHYLRHSNTNEYFICGNDLEEYVVYNITHHREHQYVSRGLFEPEKRTSHYWYITGLLYNPTADLIAVNGQDTTNCPTVTVMELNSPDVVPLKTVNLGIYLGQHYEEGTVFSALAWTEDNSLQLWVGEEVSETVILTESQIRALLQNEDENTSISS